MNDRTDVTAHLPRPVPADLRTLLLTATGAIYPLVTLPVASLPVYGPAWRLLRAIDGVLAAMDAQEVA